MKGASSMEQHDVSTVPTVAAVVVTYQPDVGRLRQLLSAVERQVQFAVIVDNGSPEETVTEIRRGLAESHHLIASGDNQGIAAAQNIGLSYVRQRHAEYVLMLDQDSAPPEGMVARLLSHHDALTGVGRKVAALGPRLADDRWKSEDRLKPKGREQDVANILEVDHIIASGSIISMQAIGIVGPMKDELFIDYVDIEWCLRAVRHGYTSFIATDVVMEHRLGEPMQVLGRVIPTHSPMRHYYMVRNTVWLLRQPWLSARWRYRKVPKIALHLVINAVFARPKREHWRMMARGLHHGLTGRMGKGHD